MPDFNLIQHTVQPGDTLWNLAGLYDTTVEEIEAANPGIDTDNLIIGQVIAIPEPQMAAEQWPLPVAVGPWGPWRGPWGWWGPWGAPIGRPWGWGPWPFVRGPWRPWGWSRRGF
jgi:hypothetical protein